MLVSTLPLPGYVMPVCGLLVSALLYSDLRSGLIRTLFKLLAVRTPSFLKKKERYPYFIERSNRQYRENRSKTLSKLIGKNFRTLRGHRNLSLEQAAQATGIPLKTLFQLESGTLDVTPRLLLTICDYFHVLIDCMVYQDLSIEQ